MRAGRKLKQKSGKEANKKGSPAKKPYKRPWSGPAPWPGEHVQSGSATVFNPGMQLLVPHFIHQGSRLPSMPSTTPQVGLCFLCGKMGHYRKACPLLQSGPAAKGT